MATTTATIPELKDGDRLSVEEFERRYQAATHLKKAELVEGVVYVASPVSGTHGRPHSNLDVWLGFYRMKTPFLEARVDATFRLDALNEFQPDLVLFLLPEHGGTARMTEDDYLEGSPEMALEVSVGSKARDLKSKLEAYRRTNVREYLVWLVEPKSILWFVLRDGQYVALTTDPNGLYKSEVFPGLWLDPEALIRGDLPTLFEVVERGVSSPEHAAFVANLRGDDRP